MPKVDPDFKARRAAVPVVPTTEDDDDSFWDLEDVIKYQAHLKARVDQLVDNRKKELNNEKKERARSIKNGLKKQRSERIKAFLQPMFDVVDKEVSSLNDFNNNVIDKHYMPPLLYNRACLEAAKEDKDSTISEDLKNKMMKEWTDNTKYHGQKIADFTSTFRNKLVLVQNDKSIITEQFNMLEEIREEIIEIDELLVENEKDEQWCKEALALQATFLNRENELGLKLVDNIIKAGYRWFPKIEIATSSWRKVIDNAKIVESEERDFGHLKPLTS